MIALAQALVFAGCVCLGVFASGTVQVECHSPRLVARPDPPPEPPRLVSVPAADPEPCP